MQKPLPNVEAPGGFRLATPKANAYPPHGGPMHKIKHIRSPAIASTSSVSFAGAVL